MAIADFIFHPFRAIRYNLGRQQDLSNLICPPYDIISKDRQEQLYAISEHNFVRIELTRAEVPERYQQAATTLDSWLMRDILVTEETPSFYLLEQEFTVGAETWGRRGLLGLVRIPENGENYILAHEKTLAKPKADRLSLMQACHAMTSPVMLMAEDADGSFLEVLQHSEGRPDAVAKEADGVVNRLWILDDPASIEAIAKVIGGGPLFIADGHHRFDTARTYREEMRAAHPQADQQASFNYALVLINSAADDALRVFPTHRLVSDMGEAGRAALEQALTQHFTVDEEGADATASDLSWLNTTDAAAHVFGVYLGSGKMLRVVVHDNAVPKDKGVVAQLDVSLLHNLLINPALTAAGGSAAAEGQVQGDPNAAALGGPNLSYTTDAVGAAAAVDRGAAEAAFFLRSTRVADVIAAASKGELMPRKSTYFYPKIPAGLVISDASAEPING